MIVSQQNINVTSINVKNHRARTRGAFSVYLRETLKVMGTATRKKDIRESEFQEISRKMSSLKMVLRWHVRASAPKARAADHLFRNPSRL